MSKEAIEFHHWMMKNDTPKNADKYFHWSDEDMFKEFLKHKNPTKGNDIPHSEIRRMESEGVYEEKFDKSNSSKDTTIYFQDEWNTTPTSENPDPAGFGKDEWDNLHHDIDGYEDKEHQLHFAKDVDIQDFEYDDEDTYIDGIDERPKKKPNVEEDDAFDY